MPGKKKTVWVVKDALTTGVYALPADIPPSKSGLGPEDWAGTKTEACRKVTKQVEDRMAYIKSARDTFRDTYERARLGGITEGEKYRLLKKMDSHLEEIFKLRDILKTLYAGELPMVRLH